MSLVPAFKMGVWNAWILMLVFAVGHLLPPLLMMRMSESFRKRPYAAGVYLNKTEKLIGTLRMPIIALLIICSIFLPLPLGTVWFYLGLAIFLLGLILYMIPSKDVFDTPLDEPFTRGSYRYSRHPNLCDYGFAVDRGGYCVSFVAFLIICDHILHFAEHLRYC